MSNVVPMTPSRDYNGSQLALIRRTVAKDATQDEFDMFIQVCRRYQLDPFRRQIYCIVYNKNNADKRTCSFVTSIDGLRSIGDRQGNYRPDEDEPAITYDDEVKHPQKNPLGIVKATVRVWKRDKAGDWHPITGMAYWDEFAPVTEVWKENDHGKRQPSGEFTLGGKWKSMPRLMIAKCAEAQALRKGWPEDLSGLYATEELDRQEALASEQVAEAEAAERQMLLGGPSMIFQFHPEAPLESVPIGVAHGRIDHWLKNAEPGLVDWFRSINRASLQDFWAKDKNAALDLKAKMETIIGKGPAA